MQAFAYRHLVPSRNWILNITRREGSQLSADLPDGKLLLIPSGGSARLTVKTTEKGIFRGTIKLVLDDPPKGISMDENTPPDGSKEATLLIHADDDIVKPGFKGNLILHGLANNTRVVFSAPAIPFEITE